MPNDPPAWLDCLLSRSLEQIPNLGQELFLAIQCGYGLVRLLGPHQPAQELHQEEEEDRGEKHEVDDIAEQEPDMDRAPSKRKLPVRVRPFACASKTAMGFLGR